MVWKKYPIYVHSIYTPYKYTINIMLLFVHSKQIRYIIKEIYKNKEKFYLFKY